ncbi:MAG: ATP-binding protein [Anaerolineae bacterium]|nr:ATP-binding protein [Anaerolineae bacterium]
MLSIRQRLTLWYTFVLMIAMIAFAVVIYVGGAWQLQRTTDRELQQIARQLAGPLLRGEDPLVVDTSYRLLTPEGQIIRSSGLPARRIPVAAEALTAAREGRTWYETVRIPLIPPDPSSALMPRLPASLAPPVRLLTVPLGRPTRFILQVGRTEADVARLRALLITTLAVGLLLGLPAAALGGWWLAGRALAPVRAMAAAANRIEAENLSERLPEPPHRDELGQLARTFNQLLDRLQAAFQRERRFTADVAHDLRTPLALMKSSIGVALNRPRSAEELRATLVETDGQIDRLAGLLDAALTLARVDSGQLQESFAPLNLSELLTDLAESSAPYAEEERRQSFTCAIAPDLWVRGDRDHLTRLFLNLLDNAMQYTPAGGAIRLTAAADGEHAVVAVEDTGIGIAAEDLPHVFERFYRADQARGAGNGRHAGLGLSIAQAIARAHGGEIIAQSSVGQGSRFTVRLPRCRPPTM